MPSQFRVVGRGARGGLGNDASERGILIGSIATRGTRFQLHTHQDFTIFFLLISSSAVCSDDTLPNTLFYGGLLV